MAVTAQPGQKVQAPKAPRKGAPSPARRAAETPLGILETIGGMMLLFGRATVACVTPPFSWKDEFIEEAWLIVKRCLIPVIISTTFFGLGAPGLQGGNISYLFGTIDRLGAFFVMASVREFAPWINGMVVAGVGGTAIAPTSARARSARSSTRSRRSGSTRCARSSRRASSRWAS